MKRNTRDLCVRLVALALLAAPGWAKGDVCAYLETLRRPNGAYAFPEQDEPHLTATHAAVAAYAALGRTVPAGEALRTVLPSLDPLAGRGWFDKRTRSYASQMRAFLWQSVKADLALGGTGRAWWPKVRQVTGPDAYPQAFEKDANPAMADVLLVPETFADLRERMPDATRTNFIAYLDARRRPNGSYNTTPASDGSDGHVVHTALALSARRHLGCPPETAAADWLRACQRPDGGFTWCPQPALGGVSDLWYVQAAVAALKGLDASPADPAALRKWLVSLRNEDGGFGDRPGAPSDPVATWRAVDVLKRMGWLDVLDLPAPKRVRVPEQYGRELHAWTIQFEAPGSGSVLEAVETARDEHIHLWGAKNADPKWIAEAQRTADRLGVPVTFFRSDESYGKHVGVPGLGSFTHIADPATPPPGAKDTRPFEVWQICDHEALARVLIDAGRYDALAVFHFSTLDNTWLMPWLNRYREEIPMTALQDSHGETWWWRAPLRGFRTVFLAKDPSWDSFREACAEKRVTAVREDEHVRGRLTFLGGTRALRDAVRSRQSEWRTKDVPPTVSVQLLTPADAFEVARPATGMLVRVRQERRFVEFKGLGKAAYRLEKAVQNRRDLTIDRHEFRHEKKDYLHGILEEAYDLIPLDPEETAPVVLTFRPTGDPTAKPLVRTVEIASRFLKCDDPLDYRVFVDGREIETLHAPRPQNRVKPHEAYPYAYAAFPAAGEVTVEVRSENFPLTRAELLPVRTGERPEVVDRGTVRFRMKPGMTRVLEPMGRHLALVLAANPVEAKPPRADDPNVVYFGPGRHRPGTVRLGSGQTLYLAPGAIVEGALEAVGTNMTVCGGGVLSGEPWAWGAGPDRFKGVNTIGIMARLVGRDIVVRDVTFFSSWSWTLCFDEAENVLVDNVKIVGGRVINDDGIDVDRSRNVVVRNSFVRSQDDCVAPKWWCEDLVVSNCTFWTDIANVVRIGYEADDFVRTGRKFSNLRFRDIDVLHLTLEPSRPEDYWCNVALSVQPVNRSRMENIVFEGWRFHAVNEWDVLLAAKGFPITHFYDFPEPGDLEGLTLRNMTGLKGASPVGVYLDAQDPRHHLSDVHVENVPDLGEIVRKGDVRNVVRARPVPSRQLLRRLRDGIDTIGIVHFTVNTFTDREWGFGSESPDDFDPTDFDAGQIVKACRDGGIRGLVIVAKHHDGFCLWPTKTTAHNITKSKWRNGKGDYVGEMEKACRRYGLRFGVYCSPWDRNNAGYATPAYVKTYHAQVEELNDGRYGEIFEMWFDGANGGDGYYGGAWERRSIGEARKYYDFARLLPRVRELQPDVCFFGGGGDGFTWPGNESGVVPPESGATRDDGRFCLYEADFPLRPGWFHHKSEDGFSRSGEFLMKIYLRTVGNGAIMDIGISPDRRGRLTDEDVGCLRRFTEIREAFFAHPAAAADAPFNVVVMSEDIARGERVDAWRLTLDGREIAAGGRIGTKRIRVFDAPMRGALRLEVVKGEAKPEEVRVERYLADEELVRRVMSSEQPKRPPAPYARKGVLISGKPHELVYMMGGVAETSSLLLTPDTDALGETPVVFRLAWSADGKTWNEETSDRRLGNVAANPVPQSVPLDKSVRVRYVRLTVRQTLGGVASARLKGVDFIK